MQWSRVEAVLLVLQKVYDLADDEGLEVASAETSNCDQASANRKPWAALTRNVLGGAAQSSLSRFTPAAASAG